MQVVQSSEECDPMDGTAFEAAAVADRRPAGAAWAAPVVRTVSNAPGTAVPRSVGLSGWVPISRTCGRTSSTVEIGGRDSAAGGVNGDRGLWVFGSRSSMITEATMTFYFPVPDLTFSIGAGNSGWTAPIEDTAGLQVSGFTAYRTDYGGAWTWNAPYRTWMADGQPHFTASYTGPCVQKQAYVRRSVTVDGRVTSFGARGRVITDLPVSDAAPMAGRGESASHRERNRIS